MHGGFFAGPATFSDGIAGDDAPAQKGAGGQNDGLGMIAAAELGLHTLNPVVLDQQTVNHCLPDV